MRFRSTADPTVRVDLRTAVLHALPAPDALYVPERIDPLPPEFWREASRLPFPALALRLARALLGDELGERVLQRIVEDAFDFEVPLVPLSGRLHVLELFHGPTLAFKDFAARFMARLMAVLAPAGGDALHVLVATSGDTGSAVAHGFRGVPGIRVHVLYPAGRVSRIQEAQLTTIGDNVAALEVDGTFDDCQRLVKAALLDPDLGRRLRLASANSVNVARLVPQSFYYAWARSRLGPDASVVFAVPSGNLGNLTAGLFAQRLGMPVRAFVAAQNVNDTLVRYLATGRVEPRETAATLSNAMDVSRPSNLARIVDLYGADAARARADVHGFRFDDEQTRAAMREVSTRYGYLVDPHGAVAYLGLESFRAQVERDVVGVFLATAHPAKFPELVERETGRRVELPPELREALARPKQARRLAADFGALREYLLDLCG
ncbi:MAG: threonine synthase [Deltaproteobacteria bacterium]|nr:threonine synthase [Deltaproteobacteria bacterium]